MYVIAGFFVGVGVGSAAALLLSIVIVIIVTVTCFAVIKAHRKKGNDVIVLYSSRVIIMQLLTVGALIMRPF